MSPDGSFRLRMISHIYRCIFVHIPKTGGSSLEEVIWPGPRSEADLWMGFISRYRNKYQTGGLQHLLARQIRSEVGQQRFAEYFKFSIVRNPYDRIVSQFVYMKERKDLREFIGMQEDDDFSRYLLLISQHQHVQWAKQTEFLYDTDGSLLVDFVARFERYEDDTEAVLQRLGLRAVQIPHLLRGNRQPDYRAYYGPGDQAKVEKMFERDISLFKYSF